MFIADDSENGMTIPDLVASLGTGGLMMWAYLLGVQVVMFAAVVCRSLSNRRFKNAYNASAIFLVIVIALVLLPVLSSSSTVWRNSAIVLQIILTGFELLLWRRTVVVEPGRLIIQGVAERRCIDRDKIAEVSFDVSVDSDGEENLRAATVSLENGKTIRLEWFDFPTAWMKTAATAFAVPTPTVLKVGKLSRDQLFNRSIGAVVMILIDSIPIAYWLVARFGE